MNEDPITQAAAEIGRPYSMTASDVLQALVIGKDRHEDAPAEDCGQRDPRSHPLFAGRWCTLPPDHGGGFHNCFAREGGLR